MKKKVICYIQFDKDDNKVAIVYADRILTSPKYSDFYIIENSVEISEASYPLFVTKDLCIRKSMLLYFLTGEEQDIDSATERLQEKKKEKIAEKKEIDFP